MGGKDWKEEARRLLADAVGINDNGHSSQAPQTVIFQAPVTMLHVSLGSSVDQRRRTLIRVARLLAGASKR